MLPENKSSIEELKNSLYSRNAPEVRTRRKLRYADIKDDVQKGWEPPKEEKPPEPVAAPEARVSGHPMSFFTKIFIGSIFFFIAAVGIGLYLFLNGANLISANNIDISVSGPVSVPGGTPVTFNVMVTNNNSVDLQLADLRIDFPAGTTDPKDPTQDFSTYKQLIGDIPAGGSVKRTVQAIVFGEENMQKQVMVSLSYNVKGSSSIFTKEKSYDILINSSPVTLAVDSFKEVSSGQEFDMKVSVRSNSQDVLKNVLLTATYPFGFSYISSDLKPLSDNATWRIGDIPAGRERTITIHGKLTGVDQDNRSFHFSVGSQSSRNQNAIGTEFMSADQEVALKKPFMTIGLSVNGDKQQTSDAIGQFNQPISMEVSWFNNLPTAISDAEIVVKLSGSAYDKTMVQQNEGYFRSSTDEMVWNQQSTPVLASIGAGQGGKVNFSITPRDLGASGRPLVNPTVSFTANVTAKHTQESGVAESLASAAARNVRISSSVSLSGQVVRTIGPFVNTGPVPPKTDQKTTYTIVWSLDNTVNPVENGQVTATLPLGVKWLNVISPTTEDLSYDESTGIVTWNTGALGTNIAASGSRKQASFQVSFEPNSNMVGSAPTLINDATFTGTDSYTGANLMSKQTYLTTSFSTDPAFKDGDQRVGN